MIRFAPPSSVTDQMSADAACSAAFDVLLNADVREGFRSSGHAGTARFRSTQVSGACVARVVHA